jgi:hypothetical protein
VVRAVATVSGSLHPVRSVVDAQPPPTCATCPPGKHAPAAVLAFPSSMTSPAPSLLVCDDCPPSPPPSYCVLPFLFCTLCARSDLGLRAVAVTVGAMLCGSAGRWVRDELARWVVWEGALPTALCVSLLLQRAMPRPLPRPHATPPTLRRSPSAHWCRVCVSRGVD